MTEHIIDRHAPEPSNEDQATARATIRHAIAAGIWWGSHRRREERRHGVKWIGGAEWSVHIANEAAQTYLAMAFRALVEVDPERAEQFAREVFCVNDNADGGEVLWGLAETWDVDAHGIHQAAIAALADQP